MAICADAGGGKSPAQMLRAYGACFDSVSLCFSKGLGAPIGSVVVGSAAFVRKARWIRKSIGGGLRQAGVISAAARTSVEDTFLGGRLGASHVRAKEVSCAFVFCGFSLCGSSWRGDGRGNAADTEGGLDRALVGSTRGQVDETHGDEHGLV